MLLITALLLSALGGWVIRALIVARRAYKRGADAAYTECLDIALKVQAKRDAAKRAEAEKEAQPC